MKILVISPHPDDETLGCGGTLLKFRDEGDSIYWLIITVMKKELGFSRETINEKEKEIAKVSKLYNFKDIVNLRLTETKIDTLSMSYLVPKIYTCISKLKPDTIFVNNRSDIHKDHNVVFKAAINATKPFRSNFVRRIFMYETISETDLVPPLIENIFLPNVFVNISKYIEKKLEIMENYKTEIMDYPLSRSLSSIKALARLRGSQIGVEYAEAFMLLREIFI